LTTTTTTTAAAARATSIKIRTTNTYIKKGWWL
jgi:hypothetical protein